MYGFHANALHLRRNGLASAPLATIALARPFPHAHATATPTHRARTYAAARHMSFDAHVGGDRTTCLLTCDTLASLTVYGGPLRSWGRICMHPLSTPTNITI
jgi:hypothetical protein